MAIQKTNLTNKNSGDQHFASEYNTIKTVVDNNADELTAVKATADSANQGLANKADATAVTQALAGKASTQALGVLSTKVDQVEDKAEAPSHVFFGAHFVVDGTTTIGGVVYPVLKINPAFTTGGGGGPDTQEELLEILGIIPREHLPNDILNNVQFYYDEVTGEIWINTELLGGGVDLKTLPNYDPDDPNRIIFGGPNPGWGPLPSGGDLEQIATPTLTLGTPNVDSIPGSWDAEIGGTNYIVERDTVLNFLTPVQAFSGSGLSQIFSGLSPNTHYYFRIKATGQGYQTSAYGYADAITAASGNVTPAAPSGGTVNDNTNAYGFNIVPGIALAGNYEYTVTGGGSVAGDVTVNPIPIGNVAKAPGQVGVRVKAATGRNAGPWLFNTQPFTVTLINPPALASMTVNDIQDKITVALPSTGGPWVATDVETSIDNGVTYFPHTTLEFAVGNVALAIGTVKSRIKAASGRNAGPAISNTVAFTESAPNDAVPIVDWHGLANGTAIDENSFTFTTPAGQYGLVFADKKIPAGENGYVQFDAVRGAADVTAALSMTPTVDDGGGHGGPGLHAWYTVGSKVVSRIGGVWNDSAYTPPGVTTKIRGRVNATTMFVEISVDNAASWSIAQQAVRPGGDTYIRAFTEVGTTGALIQDIVGSGLVD